MANNPINKRAEIQTDISPKKTNRWAKRTGRDAQYHWLLEKFANENCNEVPPHTVGNGHHWKKPINKKCWRGYGEKGTPLHCRWECKLVQPLWKIMWSFLSKLKCRVAVWSSNPTPGYLSKRVESGFQRDVCTPVFTAALFTIAKTWRQPKCSMLCLVAQSCLTLLRPQGL